MFEPSTLIGVCGAGSMGAGIAQVAAAAGHTVVVADVNEPTLHRAVAAMRDGLEGQVRRGKLDKGEAQAIADRITWTSEVSEMSQAGLVIEAIVEDAGAKGELFATLEAVLDDEAVIATNTSSLPVTALAGPFERPRRFLGLHFFNPAPVMKLVEVIPGAATDPAVTEAARALMARWGKTAVVARDVPGFIVNRVARPFYGEGWRALSEGAADPATIDYCLRELAGFKMGPLELGDLIGHDINTSVARSIFDAYYGRTRFTPSLAQLTMVQAGRLGRKSGRGVYDYAEGTVRPEARFAAPSDAPVEGSDEGQGLVVDGVVIRPTDGRMAATLAADLKRPVALLDWSRDGASAFAASVSEPGAEGAVAAFAKARGRQAVIIDDRPGLLVARTLAQIANSAADAVRDGVAAPEDIDRALIAGANYPVGPLAWAAAYGHGALVRLLDNVAAETGEDMYRPSQALRRLAALEARA